VHIRGPYVAVVFATLFVGAAVGADEPPAAETNLVEPKLTATPDRLFASHANGTILMFNARTLEPMRSWKGEGLNAFATSATGERMATAYKKEVSYGATDQPKPTWTIKIDGDPQIESVHIVSADILAVVVGIDEGKGTEGRVVLLDTKSGKVKRTVKFKNEFITSAVGADGWDRTVSPDGDWIYLAAGAGGRADNPATITRVSMAEFVRGLKKPK
jgi:hypothetical protein